MNFPINHLFFSLLLLGVAPAALAEFDDIQRIYRQTPSVDQFEVCQHGGCAKVSQVSLSSADWKPISAIFDAQAKDAAAEREKIAQAIGLLEEAVGHKAGTSADKAGTFGNSAYSGQQDCNDEAINTTTYLRLFKQSGYLRFHEIEDMRTRNFFFTGWPHTTAVMHEIETGERFAVDSWFFDNGHSATIVPFDVWKANYIPPNSPVN